MFSCSRTPLVYICVFAGILAAAGCEGSSGAFACLNDGDCPPGCSCDASFTVASVCESDSSNRECGGTCDAETLCPEGEACVFDTTEGDVDLYACMGAPAAPGDLGASCESDADCDPQASSLGAFCCLDTNQCGENIGQCVEDCSTFSSGGSVGTFEGATCQDNTQCGDGLFCCLVPDAVGNCDFGQDQSCTCRATSDPMTGEQRCFGDTVGDGTFDSCCTADTDCESGRCCTGPDKCSFDEDLDNRFTCRRPPQ